MKKTNIRKLLEKIKKLIKNKSKNVITNEKPFKEFFMNKKTFC